MVNKTTPQTEPVEVELAEADFTSTGFGKLSLRTFLEQ
jgi:hypothetical protein